MTALTILNDLVSLHGSTPATPGQKILLAADGTCAGTVGGGAVEREVLRDLARILGGEAPKHGIRSFKLGPELGMCCGGTMSVFLEKVAMPSRLVVLGADHETGSFGFSYSRWRIPPPRDRTQSLVHRQSIIGL